MTGAARLAPPLTVQRMGASIQELPRRPAIRVRADTRRARLPLNNLAESVARVAFAYARNQHGLRDSRPLRRFIVRNAAFLWAGRRRHLVEAQVDGLSVVVPTSDRTLARSVYASGDWDPLLVGTVFEALAQIGHPVRGTVFLEIGANFGIYSLPAVTSYGFDRAIAYEPDPASFELLERNIDRNSLDGSVLAVNAALSDAQGELLLRRSASNAGDNRIVADEAQRSGGEDVVAVRATTFDDEVAAGRIPLHELGLVWLDVQGHEAQVLAGAQSLLASSVPVVLEYSSGMMSTSTRSALDDLIADHFDALVDLGWCALTDRITFQPASAIRRLVRTGRRLETDLLVLKLAARQ